MRENIKLDYDNSLYENSAYENNGAYDYNKVNRRKAKVKAAYKRKKYKRKMIIRKCMWVAAIIIVTTSSLHFYNSLAKDGKTEIINSNVEKVANLENADIAAIQQTISKNKQKQNDEEKLQLGREILDSSSSDYKTYFNDSVFWGDSLSEALVGYDFISDNEAVAVKGKNVMLAKDDINTIIAKNPTNLYLLFGMNDLECFGDVKDFKVAYEELLKSVSSKLENTNIYVMSTMYVNGKASSRTPALSRDRVSKANGYIKEICKANDYTYVDITDIYDNNPSLYEQDGIHAVAKFYPIWLNRLISLDLGEDESE